MTQTTDYEIVGSYNNQRVTSIDAERSVNLFEYVDPLGKKKNTLINTSGLVDQELDFGAATGGARGQFVFKQPSNGDTNEYIVFGASVFRINISGTVTLLGTLTTTTGYVGIDANTFQIIFVDGQHGYIWDTTASTFTQITDTSFKPKPIDVCYLDGFFIVAEGDTNRFQLSSFDQGLVWGSDTQTFTADDTIGNNWLILASTANYQTGVPFEVSTTGSLPSPLLTGTIYYAIRVDATHIRVASSPDNARSGTAIVLTSNGTGTNTITSEGQLQEGEITSHPGTIVACRTLHRRLFLFSQNFTEVWENQGIGSNLPFRRNNSLLMEYGTPAIGSIAVSFDIMMFLSQTKDGLGPVMIVGGTESLPASTRALDFQLAQYAAAGQVADCRSFLIKENGLIFYRMNFTLANHTFIYNATQSKPSFDSEGDVSKYWHEEEILNGNRHPAQTHAYFDGINYVGDYLSPVLYAVDSGTFTNNGEAIRRMRITRAIVPPGYQRMRIDRLQIDLLQGNIAGLMPTFEELDLLTEDSFTLETESGLDILLDQELELVNPGLLFVYLSISKDGGQTYGYSAAAPMGNLGQRTFRTLWRKLGTTVRGQAFVAKFEFYDPVPFIILGASWAMEVLPE
jgi:hypothetical protein